jgi:regulator of protease activity HflC (stomatin/prohibitin superfamily)
MAGVLIATVVAVVVLVWIVLYVIREQTRAQQKVDETLHDAQTPTLEYEVPTGQDPAAILAALESEGYLATVDTTLPHQVVLVACPAGTDRERARVRAVIQSASVSAMDDGVPLQVEVRFRDEA